MNSIDVTIPVYTLLFSSPSHSFSPSPPSENTHPIPNLRLRNVNGLARHEAAVHHKDQDDGVDLEDAAGKPQAAGEVIVDPAAVHPVGHQGVQAQAGGYGCALKVLRLAGGVLGDRGGGHVEAGQAGQAAEHEEGQADVVERGAHADGEGNDRGGEAE